MREIKFRAWNKDNDEMVYSFDYPYHWNIGDLGLQLLESDGTDYVQQEAVFMQFTGMRYYNDKEEIYEHDVVKGTVFKKGKESRFIGVVKYSSYPTPGFYVEGVKQYEDLKEGLHPLFKVIGNIHENPELVR